MDTPSFGFTFSQVGDHIRVNIVASHGVVLPENNPKFISLENDSALQQILSKKKCLS